MIYKNILYSNSKLLTLYFIGTFLVLLLVAFLQQSWFKLTESEFFSQEISEQIEITSDIVDEEIIAAEAKVSRIAKNEFIISDGETLASVFTEAGIDKENNFQIIKAITKIYNPKKIKVGTTINFDFGANIENPPLVPEKISIRVSSKETIEVSRASKLYKAKINIMPLIRHIAHLSTTINSSFITSASKLSIPYHSIMTLVKALSYDVDFQRDLKAGNKLEILLEKFYTQDGKFSHIGNILYSNLKLDDRNVEIFQYINKNGDPFYFNADAISVVKQLLRTPINAAKMSSGFGMRKHPVYGYSKMHTGVDFAAPVGTPILAAGNGIVEQVGRKGGYGKYVRIKHSDVYSSAYGHMRDFSKGLRKGMQIKQGQVIGYVGMTGITTGPHLHYEVLKHNKQINPSKLKLAPEIKLSGKELQNFKNAKKQIASLLKKIKPQSETVF